MRKEAHWKVKVLGVKVNCPSVKSRILPNLWVVTWKSHMVCQPRSSS